MNTAFSFMKRSGHGSERAIEASEFRVTYTSASFRSSPSNNPSDEQMFTGLADENANSQELAARVDTVMKA